MYSPTNFVVSSEIGSLSTDAAADAVQQPELHTGCRYRLLKDLMSFK